MWLYDMDAIKLLDLLRNFLIGSVGSTGILGYFVPRTWSVSCTLVSKKTMDKDKWASGSAGTPQGLEDAFRGIKGVVATEAATVRSARRWRRLRDGGCV
ncbi:hypothetical protein HXX76_012318 [Chlamydomonas incerta]|uniref:Uncharacterized protein n=1 Tax=Chlamydomonas incerta TaxID=51695 RepID=A0A835SSW5_CHLIN|nr:hypothetical protein HXX76_012318 [Chlamydomonas incerta]|eukprot:KAG2427669.1 hypothetical protein HXX76_012318 [Chlamydomonas incerta]